MIIKSMTWLEMQEHIDDDKAFYDLSFSEIIYMFGFHDEYVTGLYNVTIKEEPDLITVTMCTTS